MKGFFIIFNSRIGFGVGFAGSQEKYVEYDESHFSKLEYAIKVGYRIFDTAQSYGINSSGEKILAKLAKKNSNIFKITKIAPENFSYYKFIEKAKESYNNFGESTIDLLILHWPSYDTSLDETLDAVNHCINNKIVNYFGISNFYLKDYEIFENIIIEDKFKVIQNEFSLFERFYCEELISYCESKNKYFMNYSPLRRSDFNESNSIFIEELKKKYDISFHQIMLIYLLSKSDVTIPIPNSYQKKNIESNFNSLKMRFTKDEISRLEVEFPYKINFIKSKHINIKKNPNYIAYENINDALSNKYNNNPSPIKLAEFMKKNNEIIKPIKVKKFNDEYYLLEGNLRYWASVIAFGEDFEIPSIII